MFDLQLFLGLNFTGMRTHTHYVLYSLAYFVGLTFTVRQSSVKTVKIGPLENFPLYGNQKSQAIRWEQLTILDTRQLWQLEDKEKMECM